MNDRRSDADARPGRCDECGQTIDLVRTLGRFQYCPKCFDPMKVHHERLPEVYGAKTPEKLDGTIETLAHKQAAEITSAEGFTAAKEADRRDRAERRRGKYHAALSLDAQSWRVVDAQGETVRTGFPNAEAATSEAELKNAAAFDAELAKAHDEMDRQGFERSGWGDVEEAHAAELAEVQIEGMDADEIAKLAREQLVERYRRNPAQLEDDYDYLHMTRPDGEAGKEGS